MELRPAVDDIEAEIAFDVSMASFYPETVVANEFRERMHFKWFKDPSYSPHNVYVVIEGDSIVAGLRLINRTMNRRNTSYRMLGIAETFVLPGFRGKGLARRLTEVAIQHGRSQRYEVLAVVARKAIDGFYLPFGMFGLSSYPKATFSNLSSPFCKPSGRFTFSDALDERTMHAAYQTAYADCFGAFARQEAYWAYTLSRAARDPHVSVLGVLKQGSCVGYLVHNENVILELALDGDTSYSGLISDFHLYLARQSPELDSEIVFKASRSHRLFLEDAGCDATLSQRECLYGGHVLMVLDVDSCIQKFNDFNSCADSKELLVRSGNFRQTQGGLVCRSNEAKLDCNQTACLLGISRVFAFQPAQRDSLPWSLNPLDEF